MRTEGHAWRMEVSTSRACVQMDSVVQPAMLVRGGDVMCFLMFVLFGCIFSNNRGVPCSVGYVS